jgi:hypothetical protein
MHTIYFGNYNCNCLKMNVHGVASPFAVHIFFSSLVFLHALAAKILAGIPITLWLMRSPAMLHVFMLTAFLCESGLCKVIIV